MLTSIYFFPAWEGKELSLQDVRTGNAATMELRHYKAETGKYPNWTNALFGGMPGYLIASEYPNTFIGTAAAAVLRIFPRPVDVVFLQMVGMYMLLVVLLGNGTVSRVVNSVRVADSKVVDELVPLSGTTRGWLAAMGAVAYAFGSWNILSIEAGHISKALSLAYAPGILAGLVLCLRGRYWSGAAVTGLFACLNISANHVQITFYLFLCVGLYVLIEGIRLLRAGLAKQLVMGLVIFGVTTGLGMATYSKRLLILNEFSKETIRGKSELTAKTTAVAASPGQPAVAETSGRAKATDGLDEDYAFQYSYGIGDALTLFIPNLFGGGSGGLTEKSELYNALTSRGYPAEDALVAVSQQIPAYWGDEYGIGGPAYAGAIVVFLFVLSLFISKGNLRWYLLASAAFMLILALGKNMMVINGLLFNYFPFFNKFRAVTMALTLMQLFLAAGAALAVYSVVARKLTVADIKRPLLISFGLTGGLALLLALVGGSLLSFRGPNDSQLFGPQGGDLVQALVNDRIGLMRADAFRTFFFITVAAALIWAYVSGRLKAAFFLPLLFLFLTVDIYSVAKRYINNQSFRSKSLVDAAFDETPADAQILQDKALSYRVFDNTGDFMSDNRPSYFHKSIGGYNAAKLRRYQELIQYGFRAGNPENILNMLNVKYIIAAQTDSTGRPVGAPQAQQNPSALGNAWFVQQVQQVPNADAEMAALKTADPRTTALVDQRYADQLKGLPATLTPTGTIALTAYSPDKMTYQSDSPTEQVAVFSEIFYRGNDDWKAYIDGKETPHFRTDYVLRGLRIPAGKHIIEFRFDPKTAALGNTLDLIANVGLVLLLIAGLYFSLRGNTGNVAAEKDKVGVKA
ncbi:YfhO family protein [Fibrella aquatilis]|nr:YfhO family protein [Fibrella aquatilis]